LVDDLLISKTQWNAKTCPLQNLRGEAGFPPPLLLTDGGFTPYKSGKQRVKPLNIFFNMPDASQKVAHGTQKKLQIRLS
jgi:hypothetical protein